MSAESDDIEPSDDVERVSGIGPSYGKDLRQNGYATIEDLQRADTSDLAAVIPGETAASVKQQVGNVRQNLTTAAEAREQAQKVPGAVAKVIKTDDGKQQPKVLRKVDERHEAGATVEIHKG